MKNQEMVQDLVFTFIPKQESTSQTLFQQKLKEIETRERDNLALEQELQEIKNRVLTLSRPYVLEFCEARMSCLWALDAALQSKGFSKTEKGWMKELIIEQAHEIYLYGETRAFELLEKYLPKQEKPEEPEESYQQSFEETFEEHNYTFELNKPPRVDPTQGQLKSLYHSLIKAFHPDRETDEALRAEKTNMMKLITKAYEDQDLHTLLMLSMQNLDLQEASEQKLEIYLKELEAKIAKLKFKRKELMKFGPLSSIYKTFYSKKKKGVEQKVRGEMLFLQDKVSREQEMCDVYSDRRRLKDFLEDLFYGSLDE
jgi:hypothetical protein